MFLVIFIPTVLSLSKILESSDKWAFIVEQLLEAYITQTFILVCSVIVLTLALGVFSAYIISTYTFKGRKLLEIFLYLPMAVPPYVLSYIYVDSISFQGRLYRLFSILGIKFELNVFNMGMAIIVLSLSLFPYVYIPLKSYLKHRNLMYEDVAKLLHKSRLKTLIHVKIPMMLPTLLTAGMFVLFETLNDYGVSKYLNLKTLTVGMFDAWFQLNDMTAAFYLAFIYIGLILVVMFIFQVFNQHKSTAEVGHYKKQTYKPLHQWRRYVYPASLWIIIIFSLLWPLVELILNVIQSMDYTNIRPFLDALGSTLIIAFTASTLIIFISLFVGNFYRFAKRKWMKKMSNLFVVGYALPGVIIAFIYYVFFIQLDSLFGPIYDLFRVEGLVLSLSIWMLIAALVFRFFAIGYRQVIASYTSVGMTQTLTSYTLHMSKLKTLWFVDVPMIKKGLIAGFLISFIDISKELPMTLLLRPFNMQTLSTLTFTHINNEDIQGASLPSLALILISMVFIYMLSGKNR
ncbi:MAG: ABC transporter permease [Acholeplasmataceae bacterium]